ncbi:hypothetical protein N7447_000356 [Penicillium robsamsonii]|uniref:uncharacterized protein n=1 Tax=Penicillium robsamsonii TaxID=1792511 RepID=UPI0025495367|nr:uncharacterized protein N7447_000356 [Penicillium robsamsonii]KAJ5834330.1 hypothetical protein N7447_000356 [Penicillium robsamsonii]
MVQTRQQAHRKAQPDKRKDTAVKSGVQKPFRTTKVRKGKHVNGSRREVSLSSQVYRLLDKDASEEDFKTLLKESKDQLDFIPPLAFDNIYAKDVYYRAIHKQRLDALPWMLERQNLDNWNTLH